MRYYSPPSKKNWTGRSDPGYWYQEINLLPLDQISNHSRDSRSFGILGYACEEGVIRNQGRPGAAAGPNAFRQQLASTAWHQAGLSVYDIGDLHCEGSDMEGCQSEYAEGIEKLLRNHIFPIGIGGGHDIAFGTYSGVRNFLRPQARLGIINIDAHFDLREPIKNTNSGTPFYQAYQNEKALGHQFDYLVAGIQQAANTQALFKTAHESGTQIITNQALWEGWDPKTVDDFLDPLDAIYLTIDMDVFASAYAPGVSAASPMGISPQTIMQFLKSILQSDKLVAIDIAELSPVHDQQNQTAKLAARLFNWILQTI